MCFFMDRSRVKMEGVSEIEPAVEKSFSAIVEVEPEDLHYASPKPGDDATCAALLELENEEERDLLRRSAPA